jgi:hypothetical protein
MAHNTRPLKRAQDGIAPQHFNELIDDYEVLLGTAGASHTIICDPDGKPLTVATDAKLELVRALLASLADNDFATQTTLAAVLAALGDLATIANQNAAKTVLDAISTAVAARATETTLQAIKEALTDGSLRAQLSGNIAELSSAQHTEPATTVKTYTRSAGASRIEVYVETGRVRIRTDGEPCTAVTGEPLGEGFGAAWAVPSISVLFIDDSAVTVVSR